ncbi:tRNA (cytosine(32)/uridine(32)-2'-O)-methyltransferase TrmJ [Massilia eurypsychrophila]|jgi:tRNA/rRNA methyltransferase|uniref:tRNA (cytidine/uridine-2'-O-)-methyltransferase TrmJ n=1 Tax=Massilia eurypsychrophila TaxID=1485217 RepID=A0A2G8TD20_9BURK|nr:RNA methyltransferase [Massilia eurypsychrophila]PIL43937.1 tRNA (cytosine(32)/uridine(32)-2'-O)-methyltransferase TrmJ [Massilia eurypsychrophila]
MNQPETNISVFNRLRFVLVETSRAGNIGAVARAIKTMGFSDLVLVNPRFPDALQDPEAIAFASGAQDVLEGARIVADIAEALEGCNFAAAVSARLREFSPPVWTPRSFAGHIAGHTDGEGALTTALIFGNERFGLPNQIVEQCNVLINIPANPAYSSLNLAQAAQVLAYECRVAADSDAAPASVVGFHGDAASRAQVDGMYAHLEQALVAIDFLDADNPKKLMPRLKRLFARTELETEEVNILRGIASHILKVAKR